MNNLVSIVVPLFNETESLQQLIDQISETMGGVGRDYEIVLVDDGSSDGTFERVRELAEKDSRIVGLRFRRNYGQTAALMAGIDHARGDVCITMDGDLQHDPTQLPVFLDKIDEGYDLVCSYRFQRNDAFIRRFPSKVANALARKFSKLDIRDFGSTYRAYRTELAKQIPVYGEMHRFIPVFMGMMTNRITEIPIHLQPRLHGESKYGFGRTFRVLSDLVVLMVFSGFFNRPIHIFGYISALTGFPGLMILIVLSLGKMFGALSIGDHEPMFIMGIMLTLFSAQMFSTGIVCEYLIRIYYSDPGRRPYTLFETVGREKPD